MPVKNFLNKLVNNELGKKDDPFFLKSDFFEELDIDNPLPEYPRPTLARKDWVNLNGEWEYYISSIINELIPGKTFVPFGIETPASTTFGRVLNVEKMWYYRAFRLPKEWKGKKIIIHFDAIDWTCELSINNHYVGVHAGGYNRFSFDITKIAKFDGNNIIKLMATDPTDQSWQQRGLQVLFPKGSFHKAVSGIWKTVWVEAVDTNYIEDLKMTPNIDKKELEIKVSTKKKTEYTYVITDENGKEIKGTANTNKVEKISIENPILWSPENPHLYSIKITTEKDEVESYFGMRKFSIIKGKDNKQHFALNNNEYFQIGVLDQGYWPEGYYTPVCEQQMVNDIQKMKELGFNMIRKHEKVENDRWYYLCDKLGMIVWQDMVSGGKYSEGLLKDATNIKLADNNIPAYFKSGVNVLDSRQHFEKAMLETIEQLYNHPSIATWIMFNDNWGQFDSERLLEEARKADKSRPINVNCGGNDYDIGDFYAPNHNGKKIEVPVEKQNRCFVIGKSQGFSMFVKGNSSQKKAEIGASKYKNSEELTEQYERLVKEQIIPMKENGLSAYVFRQLADIDQELKGIYTYDRKVCKYDSERMKKANESLTK